MLIIEMDNLSNTLKEFELYVCAQTESKRYNVNSTIMNNVNTIFNL